MKKKIVQQDRLPTAVVTKAEKRRAVANALGKAFVDSRMSLKEGIQSGIAAGVKVHL